MQVPALDLDEGGTPRSVGVGRVGGTPRSVGVGTLWGGVKVAVKVVVSVAVNVTLSVKVRVVVVREAEIAVGDDEADRMEGARMVRGVGEMAGMEGVRRGGWEIVVGDDDADAERLGGARMVRGVGEVAITVKWTAVGAMEGVVGLSPVVDDGAEKL